MSIPAIEIAREPGARTTPLRFVSAASLFDGHDAAINMIRRLLQAQGAEVVHLGHNRSVADIVRAAIEEDADGIAVSSYQGGHDEYFRYMVDMLRERGYEHIRVVVGGGGTIAPQEIEALERYGVEKIYTPEDGRRMGLVGMIEDVIRRVRAVERPAYAFHPLNARDHGHLARTISVLEGAGGDEQPREAIRRALARVKPKAPVIGITGTGGAGKSSLTDELLARLVRHFPGRQIAVVAMDPTRRRTGGALLGDRIRMNSLAAESIFMRSLATRRQHLATSAVLKDVIDLYQLAGFDLIIIETAGIGQSDTEIVELADLSIYVMTAEYGAASQLEKIDMLDFADLIVLNKSEKRGTEDALRDVRKQWRRNHPQHLGLADDEVPVYPTIASRFNDPGVNRLFAALAHAIGSRKIGTASWQLPESPIADNAAPPALIPGARIRYLAEIAQAGRARENAHRKKGAGGKPRLWALSGARESQRWRTSRALRARGRGGPCKTRRKIKRGASSTQPITRRSMKWARRHWRSLRRGLPASRRPPPRPIPIRCAAARDGRELLGKLEPSAAAQDRRARLSRLGRDPALHLQGESAGSLSVYRRRVSLPARGGGSDAHVRRRGRARAHQPPLPLSRRRPRAARLSTAFDSTTLYGEDPDTRPDIYGRTGNSGVSIATLDDLKKLYSGFDLCSPTTSVSMTINGPAPMLLAMFMNAAIDQRIERYLKAEGKWAEAEKKIKAAHARAAERGLAAPQYKGALPAQHDGTGLALLGVSGDFGRARRVRAHQVRGACA
jgi:methylmalonyl-CoA mutase